MTLVPCRAPEYRVCLNTGRETRDHTESHALYYGHILPRIISTDGVDILCMSTQGNLPELVLCSGGAAFLEERKVLGIVWEAFGRPNDRVLFQLGLFVLLGARDGVVVTHCHQIRAAPGLLGGEFRCRSICGSEKLISRYF